MDKIFNDLKLIDFGVALLDMVMPRRCVVCRGHLQLRERFICTGCLAELPLTHFWTQTHNPMADRFNERVRDSMEAAGSSFEQYAYAAALFFYNSETPYKHIPQHLKYEAGIASGRFFSEMLGRRMAAAEHFSDVDMVVPVPLHWRRRWKRGYNQAEVIADELARSLGASVRSDVLRRSRSTRTQIGVSVEGKSANVSGAFTVRRSLAAGPLPRHILLVDDTFTTGSTLNACREALREVLPPSVRISIATLAFVRA